MSNAAINWRQRLPPSKVVVREPRLLEIAQGRRVIHLGFVDYPILAERLHDGSWLHARLATVAGSLVGLDISADGVRRARELGFTAYAVDLQDRALVEQLRLEPADVVVAGELIEHVSAAGPFLEAIAPLVAEDGVLVITTPNGLRPLNTAAALRGFELVHPDHVAWYTPYTLKNVVERCGLEVVELSYYNSEFPVVPRDRGVARFLEGVAAWLLARCAAIVSARVASGWADGLIVVARRRR